MSEEFETVIGLEVHVQLSTLTKLFCGCSTRFGQEPNSQTCPVCLGLPGSLPVLNHEAFRRAIKVGLALDGEIARIAKFDRKNYYYPDLPKNYQISQYDRPVSSGGELKVQDGTKTKTVRITRAHLEEDAGKLVHSQEGGPSRVDFNRAGTPLLEIVSEPDLASSAEAARYLSQLKAIILYLEVGDCNMEEGSLRCDANISVRKAGEKKLGVKTEIKNLNSFKAVEKALEYEKARHIKTLKENGRLVQETRLWDEKRGVTVPMRSKEEAHDYRYFPEPDLVPFRITREEVDAVRGDLPELPNARLRRFQSDLGLNAYDSGVLVADKALADFCEKALHLFPKPKQVANWLTGPLLAELNARSKTIAQIGLQPEALVELLKLVEGGTLSHTMAKEVFTKMLDTGRGAGQIVQESGLKQESDEGALQAVVEKVIGRNEQPVKDYLDGRGNAVGFLVGQVMKETRGRANPQLVNRLLEETLKSKKRGS